MPQASDELRAQMAGYFGGDGIDNSPPYRYLYLHGWKDQAGMLIAPPRKITQKEWDCVDFLCDEARKEEDRRKAENWARIQAADAAAVTRPDGGDVTPSPLSPAGTKSP